MFAINEHRDMEPDPVLIVQDITAHRRIFHENICQHIGHRGADGLHRTIGCDMTQMRRKMNLGHAYMVPKARRGCKRRAPYDMETATVGVPPALEMGPMPGVMWYFVIAIIVLLGVILAVPSEGAADHMIFPTAIPTRE